MKKSVMTQNNLENDITTNNEIENTVSDNNISQNEGENVRIKLNVDGLPSGYTPKVGDFTVKIKKVN